MTVTDMHVCDLIGSISQNQKAGNITPDDARKLRQLTHRLYRHLYAGYREMEVLNEMTDESLLLDADIWEKEMEELKEQYENKLTEQKIQFANQKKQLTKILADRDRMLADRDRELTELKAQLAQLKDR